VTPESLRWPPGCAWVSASCWRALSYTELGWGGYWGWDAVEDAALMPWLITTAFIHSIQIQEKRGMLKVWNVSLVLLSGTLAIFGTFLCARACSTRSTRSGRQRWACRS